MRVRATNTRVAGLAGGPLSRAVQLDATRLPARVQSNEHWLMITVERETTLCFAGPGPERVIGCIRALGTFDGIPIFVPHWFEQIDEAAGWLRTHAALLAPWVSAAGERLLVARNQSTFYLTPTGTENDLQRLDALITAVEHLPAPREQESFLAVPDHLHSLIPLVATWSMADDDQRSAAIARATDHELDELWRSVAPHLDAIDAFLDGSSDVPGAVELGDLAQAAVEARRELSGRGKKIS